MDERDLAAGLAVPEVLLSTDDAGLWGTAGLVMRRVAGETVARRILRDAAYREARKVLVRQVGEFAAGLHALDLPEDLPAPDPLADLRAQLAGLAGNVAARLAVANPRYFETTPPAP